MRIVCDENIVVTAGLTAIATELRRLPGRNIDHHALQDADALLVRSVTRVDAALLRGSSVRFVGTATAGVEHIDQAALRALGVGFAAAPGSNAQAVAEWVLSALAHSGRLGGVMMGGNIGIVGLGAVGQRVAAVLTALGGRVLAHDPLREPWPSVAIAAPLEAVLGCAVVTLHASLHDLPPHPSRHLVTLGRWPIAPQQLPQLLINAGRGGLVSRETLMALHDRGVTLSLDTWPDEPVIDRELLARSALATPHIAGYTHLAKVRATETLTEALMTHLASSATPLEGVAAAPTSAPVRQSAPTVAPLHSDATEPAEAVADWLLCHYDIAADDCALRDAAIAGEVSGAAFDTLRRTYPQRKELSERRVQLNPNQDHLKPYAAALGLTSQGEQHE